MNRDDGKKGNPPEGKPFNNPFASLSKLREELPSLPQSAEPPKVVFPNAPSRAVVRLERKGRGGKEVTVVSHLGLPSAELERYLKALKNGLGCGGAIEDDVIVLQGDQRERVPTQLEKLGVRKITVS